MMVSKGRVILSILALPFVVLVVIPGVILYLEAEFYGIEWTRHPQNTVLSIISIPLCLLGVTLLVWTNCLFIRKGRGTLAPWDPPREFIIEGPYRHVRNPMIIGVGLILAAGAVVFRSTGITFWAVLFILVNMIYFPLKEEKDLIKRFGDDYREYRQNVPAWIPRLTPWGGENER
jgi:protein-S-isoprenylcysteine O-methyltransferase Ste14